MFLYLQVNKIYVGASKKSDLTSFPILSAHGRSQIVCEGKPIPIRMQCLALVPITYLAPGQGLYQQYML